MMKRVRARTIWSLVVAALLTLATVAEADASVSPTRGAALGSPGSATGVTSAHTESGPPDPVIPEFTEDFFGAGAEISRGPNTSPGTAKGRDSATTSDTSPVGTGATERKAQTTSCSSSASDERCRVAQAACSGATAAVITDNGGAFVGYVCGGGPPSAGVGPAPAAAPAAPPVPTFGQIQQAFRELPFCKPSPSMQPVGGKTVVNLATYYEAGWPDGACLSPGETSAKVQLLSWSVEFKVAARDYRFSYGDGASSGWTTSTGGGYPDGDITHAYRDTGSVDVRVDARLTGSYRVDGGAWQDIETVADLQDEPAATYEVVEAKNRLQADPTG